MANFLNLPEIEWGDVRFDIEARRILKIQSIDFGAKMDKELLYGEGPDPIGTQNGNRSYDCKLGILVGTLIELNAVAVAAGGKDVLDLKLGGVLRFRKRGERPTYLYRMENISFQEYRFAMTQGDKKMMVELPGVFEKLIPGVS